MAMSSGVTVVTAVNASVVVPFTSDANAALAQAALDVGANAAATAGFMAYFSPPDSPGTVDLPPAAFFGGVVDTVPAALNFGILDAKYTSFVNAGSGLAAVIGGPDTTLVSGANASTIYVNQGAHGQAYVGGGSNVLGNAFSTSHLDAYVDQAPGGALGASTLILDDRAGGSMTARIGAGVLVQLLGGGADSIVAQGGTVAVLTTHQVGDPDGVATISAASAGTDLWVGLQGEFGSDASPFITPGDGNVFVFGGEGSGFVTLFGGMHVFNGETVTAPAFTGRATVAGANGYIEAGSAGGSILQSGLGGGTTTLVAGGAGDVLLLRAQDDTADLGNAENVTAYAGSDVGPSGRGDTFLFGSGSGTATGGTNGSNTFIFQGAGDYTVTGFHDTNGVLSTAPLLGSVYRAEATGPGGSGHITIQDFLPAMFIGSATVQTVFDRFEFAQGVSLSSMATTDLGGGFFDSTAVLSDGTTVTFKNTFGVPHDTGSGAIV
jgi:hypothetical protein